MFCNQAKEYLSQKGIPFHERDIAHDPDALADLKKIGYMTTPVVLVLCIINNFTITGMVSILAVPCGTWRIRCPFRLSNDGRWRRGLPLVTRHRRWSSDHAWC